MRISIQSTIETSKDVRVIQSTLVEKASNQGSTDTTHIESELSQITDYSETTEEKLQQAVDALNEILDINHNSSKFVYHEGLDRYFVQVVNKDTEEVVKEIPPRKLLDAFYEMQKLVGMIVDEKI